MDPSLDLVEERRCRRRFEELCGMSTDSDPRVGLRRPASANAVLRSQPSAGKSWPSACSGGPKTAERKPQYPPPPPATEQPSEMGFLTALLEKTAQEGRWRMEGPEQKSLRKAPVWQPPGLPPKSDGLQAPTDQAAAAQVPRRPVSASSASGTQPTRASSTAGTRPVSASSAAGTWKSGEVLSVAATTFSATTEQEMPAFFESSRLLSVGVAQAVRQVLREELQEDIRAAMRAEMEAIRAQELQEDIRAAMRAEMEVVREAIEEFKVDALGAISSVNRTQDELQRSTRESFAQVQELSAASSARPCNELVFSRLLEDFRGSQADILNDVLFSDRYLAALRETYRELRCQPQESVHEELAALRERLEQPPEGLLSEIATLRAQFQEFRCQPQESVHEELAALRERLEQPPEGLLSEIATLRAQFQEFRCQPQESLLEFLTTLRERLEEPPEGLLCEIATLRAQFQEARQSQESVLEVLAALRERLEQPPEGLPSEIATLRAQLQETEATCEATAQMQDELRRDQEEIRQCALEPSHAQASLLLDIQNLREMSSSVVKDVAAVATAVRDTGAQSEDGLCRILCEVRELAQCCNRDQESSSPQTETPEVLCAVCEARAEVLQAVRDVVFGSLGKDLADVVRETGAQSEDGLRRILCELRELAQCCNSDRASSCPQAETLEVLCAVREARAEVLQAVRDVDFGSLSGPCAGISLASNYLLETIESHISNRFMLDLGRATQAIPDRRDEHEDHSLAGETSIASHISNRFMLDLGRATQAIPDRRDAHDDHCHQALESMPEPASEVWSLSSNCALEDALVVIPDIGVD